MRTLIIEFGRCGFGTHDGLVPGVRLGLVQVAWTRGSLLDQWAKMKRELDAAADQIRRMMP